MQVPTSLLRQRQTTIRNNWGFRFALWCAILWAFGYQGLDYLVHSSSLLGSVLAGVNPYLVGLAIAVVFTVLLSVISLVWVGVNHGLRDWVRTVSQLRGSNLILIAAAIIGGAIAYVSYVITFLVDSGFAVAMVMFYSCIGAAIAHLWYKERITRRGVIGLLVIACAGLLLYLAVTEASGEYVFAVLGMGMFAGLGWGVEGALASRAMDVVDSNIAMSVRFTYEAVIWLLIFLVSVILGQGEELVVITSSFFSTPAVFLMLCLAALCIHFDYLSWYKSFIYCGVGRGLAVSTTSSAFTAIIGLALSTALPDNLSVLGFVFMVVGVLMIFTSQDSNAPSLRDVGLDPSPTIVLGTIRPHKLPLKTRLLVEIAERGRSWDYRLASSLIGDSDTRRKRHLYNKLRIYLVEAQAAGLVVILDERIDDGGYFGPDKLLCNYALTEFGCKRLQEMQLIITEE